LTVSMTFLDYLVEFLETGRCELPGKQRVEEDYFLRAAFACSIFEREVYKRLGNVSESSYKRFYHSLILLLHSHLNDISSLDLKSRNVLLRNLDSAAELLPEFSVEISIISKSLL